MEGMMPPEKIENEKKIVERPVQIIKKEDGPYPNIEFPDNIGIVKSLQGKLSEYKERLNAQNDGASVTDTNYKIEFLQRLLTDGEVDPNKLMQELKEKYGRLDMESFNNARGVIEDYVWTGGKHVHGGTGFEFEKNSADGHKGDTKIDMDSLLNSKNIERMREEKIGVFVKILRSSGFVENDWQIGGFNPESGLVRVLKVDKGQMIYKDIPLKELKQWNVDKFR